MGAMSKIKLGAGRIDFIAIVTDQGSSSVDSITYRSKKLLVISSLSIFYG